jgi:IrrE N-terminal-like domain
MIDESSRREIDKHVSHLLLQANAKGRFPTPIHDLMEARKLSKSAPDDSPLAFGSILRAPLGLQRRLTAVAAKVLAVLDRRERIVHVRPDKLEVQQRFNECHEIGHDLCEWHVEPYYLDGKEQLDLRVTESFEGEANYAAAELLFQADIFKSLARSSTVGMASVVDLATRFGGSIHASFRKYLMELDEPVAGIVMGRPWRSSNGDTVFPVRHFMATPRFVRDFAFFDAPETRLSSSDLSGLEAALCEMTRTGFIGRGTIALQMRTGIIIEVPFELFTNTYNHFLLIHPQRAGLLKRKVSFAVATAIQHPSFS